MKVDLSSFETWENINAKVAAELQVSSAQTVRCFPGLPAAIFEMLISTAQFYSHKRSVAIVGGQTPHMQSVMPYLYKEGYEVQILPAGMSPAQWVDSLRKDTCFAIFCEDHPVTGELFPISDFETSLNEKKIFCFRISHHNHLYQHVDSSNEIQAYSARICSFDPQTAVAIMGERQKAASMLAPFLSWDENRFLAAVKSSKQSSKENKELVESFESQLPEGFHRLLETEKRCFDRALIYSESAGGESLQNDLARHLKISLQSPSWERQIETTHLCRWGGVGNYDLWWNPRPSDNILRGLLILSLEVLHKPQLKLALQKALQEC